jgi:predicted HicB family RNase H-like nuclease
MSETRSKHRAGLPLRNFPLELKRALAARAAEQGTNFNDLCVTILALKCKVRYRPQPRPSSGVTDSTYVTLEMPEQLRAKIKATAAMKRLSSQAFVIDTLAASLNGG